MTDVQLITTEDGSHSLFNPELNETYHSIHGAMQESTHVFIRNGLAAHKTHDPLTHIKILEIGFGTGLNALLSLQFATESDVSIHYTAIEAYPLEMDILDKLNYPLLPGLGKFGQAFRRFHAAKSGEESVISKNFTLVKKIFRIQDVDLEPLWFDLIYFDAFGPAKQPDMWERPVLYKVEQSMAGRGIFVTYSAKGQLKRDLRSLGLRVETLPGPPGKKEMVRALKS